MDDQDTRATEPANAKRAAEVASGSGRRDDRNDEAAGSPAPDPTEPESHADEVPQAD